MDILLNKNTTLAVLTLLILSGCGGDRHVAPPVKDIRALNHSEISARGSGGVQALTGATLIDGNGGEPLKNSCIIIRDGIITDVGVGAEIDIPDDAVVTDVKGLTMLPGLIDAHYHNEDSDSLASAYLRNGVTSVRDPGEWIESYDALRRSGKPLPRLFLAGPHLDTYPPAYPADAWTVKDPDEAALAVDRLASQGATVIKAYYGLSIGMIKAICDRAHDYGLPVTAHLEITSAKEAILAGLDGIEHVTSFGSDLLPMPQAEEYKQRVRADHNARRRGRYEVWASLDLANNSSADSLIKFLAERRTFVSPTLAVFERRPDTGDSTATDGFMNMLRFVGKAHRGGVRFVVGSHSYVPYADFGMAYHREMELLHEAGLSNMEVIRAATIENARFFRVENRMGTLEAGKVADLFLVGGDPLQDISVLRNVKRVMLNGNWVNP